MTTDADWLLDVLGRYHVRRPALRLLRRRTRVTIHNRASTSGGGLCHYAWPPSLTWIELWTAQHEAAVHEAAHAWWWEMYVRNRAVHAWRADVLVAAFLRESEAPRDEYADVRRLCATLRAQPGMREGDGWNHYEIFASIASGVMGDLDRLPPSLRGTYTPLFGVERVYLPVLNST